jgi:hypothetical protein
MVVLRALARRWRYQRKKKDVMRTTNLIAIMMVALLFHSGCSFLFVKGPPEQHAQMSSFDCSESNAWPVIDTIWAGLNGLGAISASNDSTTPSPGQPSHSQVVAVGVSWLVVSGISAIYGFSKVSTCNDARRQREERYQRAAGVSGAPPVDPDAAMPSGSPQAPVAPRATRVAPPPAAPASVAPGAARAAPPPAAPAPQAAPAAPAAPTPAGNAAPTGVAPGSAAPGPSASRRLPTVPGRAPHSRSLAMRPVVAAD